jgi:hypothetical protein
MFFFEFDHVMKIMSLYHRDCFYYLFICIGHAIKIIMVQIQPKTDGMRKDLPIVQRSLPNLNVVENKQNLNP